MNPDRRMNELELIVAENVQKTDRLIDGMGQVVDLNTRIQADVNQMRTGLAENKTAVSKLSSTADITVRGVAKLTVSTQAELLSVRQDIATLRDETQAGFDKLAESTQAGFDQLAESTRTQIDQLAESTQVGFNNVDARFKSLSDSTQAGFNNADARISELRTEMNEQIGGLRTEMNEQIGGLRTEMNEQIGGLRTEMNEQIGGLRTEMSQRFDQLVTLIQNRPG
jgi:DNA anti-recombination protein RmuC